MNDTVTPFKESQARLAQDFKAVVNDVDELLRHAAQSGSQSYSDARARLEQSLQTARRELASAETAVLDGARQAARSADEYVHRHPWESMGIGAAVGLLIGMLIARR